MKSYQLRGLVLALLLVLSTFGIASASDGDGDHSVFLPSISAGNGAGGSIDDQGIEGASSQLITLKDSSGNPLQGGIVRIGTSGWPRCPGETDSSGTILCTLPNNSVSIRMEYNKTTATQTKAQLDASAYTFSTVQAIIQLKDSAGNPINGGEVRFGTSGWPVIGSTDSAGSGAVAYQVFPGTYNFRMAYNYGTEQKSHVVGSGPLVFQTGLVDLQFSGVVQHGVGGWPAYSGPTEMLPIEHRFGFSGPGYTRQELRLTPTAGAVFQRSVVYLKLLSSTGGGLAGGVAKWADGSWYDIPGTTDASGILLYAIEGLKGDVKVAMNWNQGSVGITQHQPSNSFYLYQTAEATIRLLDDAGAGIAGGKVDQGGGFWQGHGYTDGSGELKLQMFPGSYKFRMGINYTAQEKTQDIATPIEFQTGKVAWDEVTTPAPTQASLSGSWQTFVNNWQLLPGTYTFTFNDASSQPVTVTTGATTNVPNVP